MAAKKRGDKPTIIIRREEVVEGGHHGGAWKVAYADFVTAMMAFFLLMWLLNATTEEQRRGLADYFSPNNVMARNTSGFGAPFGGLTPNIDGSLASTKGAVQVVMAPPHPVIDSDDEEGDIPAHESPGGRPGPPWCPRRGRAAPPPPCAPRPASPTRMPSPSAPDVRTWRGAGRARGARTRPHTSPRATLPELPPSTACRGPPPPQRRLVVSSLPPAVRRRSAGNKRRWSVRRRRSAMRSTRTRRWPPSPGSSGWT